MTTRPPIRHGLRPALERVLFVEQLRHRSRELTRAFGAVRMAARISDSEALPLAVADHRIVRGVD